jgi:pyrroloquinoline quinone biosynthesis protein D
MKIFRNPDVMWREEDKFKAQAYEGLEKGDDVENIGTSVLYLGGTMLALNILGTEIWKKCDGSTTDKIISELTDQFDVEPAILQGDVLKFLSELKEKGFIYYEE